MRNSADQQGPHSCGIDESGPRGPDRLTSSCVSNVATDDALKSPGALPETDIKKFASLGYMPNTDVTHEAFPTEGGAVDPRGYPLNDFGSPTATRKVVGGF